MDCKVILDLMNLHGLHCMSALQKEVCGNKGSTLPSAAKRQQHNVCLGEFGGLSVIMGD
jgi:hypothetical protein